MLINAVKCETVGQSNFLQLFICATSKVAQLDFTGCAPQTNLRQKKQSGCYLIMPGNCWWYPTPRDCTHKLSHNS